MKQYIYRTMMEEKLGRKLETWEVIHHINGDHKDNRVENLKLMTNSEHVKLHSVGSLRRKSFIHGTLSAYRSYKCHCQICISAESNRVMSYRHK